MLLFGGKSTDIALSFVRREGMSGRCDLMSTGEFLYGSEAQEIARWEGDEILVNENVEGRGALQQKKLLKSLLEHEQTERK